MNKKYKKLLNDTIIFAIGGIGSKLILFFLMPLYTNYLSTDEYGIADLIFTVSQLVIPFVSLVIFDSVLRFALSKIERSEDVLLNSLIVWGIGSIVTILLTPLIGLYSPIANWRWHLCAYIILNILMSVELNYIKAKERNRLYAVVSIVQTLAMALANVLLIVVIPLGIDGYVFANIIGCSISVIIIFLFGKLYKDLKFAKFSPFLLKKMLLFSAPLVLNNISWWAMHSANKIIIEFALGASILGIYTVATKIPSLINVMISIFQQSWGISSVKEIESSNESDFYSNVFKIFSFVAFAMSVGLIFIIKPLMHIYVGEDFIEAWKYIPVLLASATFSAISSYFVSLYSALKKSLNNMIATLISAVVNIVVVLILVDRMGIWAAILGTFFAYFVMAILRMIEVTRYIKMKIDVFRFVINSVIVITQAFLVSMEIKIYLVSTIAAVLFFVTNIKFIKSLFLKLR